MAASETIGWSGRALDLDREVIADVNRRCLDESVEQFPFDCLPLDVDVPRRASSLVEPEVECEAPFEQPAVPVRPR